MLSKKKALAELSKRKKMFKDYLCRIKNTPAGTDKQQLPEKKAK
jgi:hypothetical protein